MKLLVPLKLSAVLFDVKIAPPSAPSPATWLLMKLLVPLKLTTVLTHVQIAPPYCAELLIKLLVPLKLSTVFLNM